MSKLAKMVYDDPNQMYLLWDKAKDDVSEAATATVNIKVSLARRYAVNNIQENLTLRNDFTKNRVKFTPIKYHPGIKIDEIRAEVGALEEISYMARQETGGPHTPSKGDTLAIPTNRARGGSKRQPVLMPMLVPNILKEQRVHGKSTRNLNSLKAWFVARAYSAYTHGLFLPAGGSGDQRNLHAVISFNKSGDSVKFKLAQVYRFDMPKTETPATPWLMPACEKVEKDSQRIFESQMKKRGL
jgi:hypothetical protein